MSKVKIYELAKELNMPSRELLDKVVSMGIEAKTHMSAISEIDAISVKNTILRGKSGTETKIVKVAVRPQNEENTKVEKKIVVKAATNISASPEAKKSPNQTQLRAGSGNASHGKAENQGQAVNTPKSDQSQMKQVANKATHGENTASGENDSTRVANTNAPRANTNAPRANTDAPRANTDAPRANTNAPRANTNAPRANTNAPRANTNAPRANTNAPRANTNAPRANTNVPRENTNVLRANTNVPRENTNAPRTNTNQHVSTSQGSKPNQSTGDRRTVNQSGGQLRPNNNQAKPRTPGAKDQKNSRNVAKAPVKPVYNAAGLAQKHRAKPQRPKPAPKPTQPEIELEEMEPGTKIINVPITVAGFAEQIEKSNSAIIMSLMKMGIMANINQNLDEDTVLIIGEELGVPIIIGKVQEEIVEEGLDTHKDREEDLKPRSPIITVMGHVDHGKTSLLDAIRKTNVVSGESGGITQHIGASEVSLKGQKIVFLDTPGHEAFTAMRARGAHSTDIAVLVVAADDSVKPQTIESISHAKAAGVPIIVAINKIDKPGADLNRVKQDLTEHGILIEEWGGDTICVPVSAKTGEGIVNLLEMILLQAEVLELRANPNRLASGTVIEARLDTTRGTVATLLVLNGTLKSGMSIVAGTCSGKIKAMHNFKGGVIRKAGPATAVEVLGLSEIPQAGDEFNAIKEDKVAREIAENRRVKQREEVMARNSSSTLEQLFSQMEEGEVKDLNLIIKGDVQGSVGALVSSLEKLKNENIKVKIIYAGVGTVTESDIMLANTSGAIIIAFNVRPSTAISTVAEREGVEIRTYRVIYNVIDEVESAMKGMLDPVFKEVVLGKIEVRETFKVPGIGIIAGAYVLEGKVERNAAVRLVRDGIVVHEGKISSLKRFKDDVKEVAHGFECGIGIENYSDLKEGDIIEAFKMEEVERK